MQPGHSQDYLLSAKAKDHKVGVFSGLGKDDVCVGLSSDCSFDVCGSIYIVYLNGLGKAL